MKNDLKLGVASMSLVMSAVYMVWVTHPTTGAFYKLILAGLVWVGLMTVLMVLTALVKLFKVTREGTWMLSAAVLISIALIICGSALK